jgi:hypothetical protein
VAVVPVDDFGAAVDVGHRGDEQDDFFADALDVGMF